LPVGAETLQGKEKLAESLKVDFEAFKKYLINHN
jgi:threonine synthase